MIESVEMVVVVCDRRAGGPSSRYRRVGKGCIPVACKPPWPSSSISERLPRPQIGLPLEIDLKVAVSISLAGSSEGASSGGDSNDCGICNLMGKLTFGEISSQCYAFSEQGLQHLSLQ